MKKFFIVSAFVLLGLILALYAAFLIVPPFIKLDKYKTDIQKLVLDNTKLNLDYSKIKIFTTPFLSLGVKIEDVSIKLPDNSELFKASKIKGGIALPNLLALTVKTSKCYVDDPYINLEIVDDEQYKIIKIVEDIINENNAKPKTAPQEPLPVDVEKIKIKIPSIKINNYLAKINDLKSNHNLTLSGEKLVLGYDSKKNIAKFKTIAKLMSDEKENITADIALSSSLPEAQADKEEVDPEERIKIPFVNIVKVYQTYDLKLNTKARLKIRDKKENGYRLYGYLNVDDLNLKLSEIRLPNSYFHAKFNGQNIKYDTNIYTLENEKIALAGGIKFGKKPKLKTNIISDEIHFENVAKLLKGLLDSLNIKNDIALIKTTGYLKANAKIKTNFKKLKSEGLIVVKEGSFVNPSYDIGIKDVSGDFLFDNNTLNIKDAKASVNNSKLTLEGSIDRKSNVAIKAYVDSLALAPLYRAFAPREIKKDISLNNALLNLNVNVNGKLEKPKINVETTLDDLDISDAKNTMFLKNKNLKFTLEALNGKILGKLQNQGFLTSIPSLMTNAKIDKLLVDINEADITINPFDLIYNNSSKINIKGDIANYFKNPDVNAFVSGALLTSDIKQTLGKDISYFIPSSGQIPLRVSIKGNSKKQEILSQIYADKNNFITPINFNELLNSPSIIQADVKINGNKIKIKNSGLYKKTANSFGDDLSLNMQGAKRIIDLTSVIEGEHINLFRLQTQKELTGSVGIFKKSSFKTSGKISLHGKPDNLVYGGDYRVVDLNIPEILFSIKNIDLNFVPRGVDLYLKDIDINKSKINASLSADLNPKKIFRVDNINVLSDMIDVDNALKVVEKLANYMPKPSASASNSKTNQDIPLYAKGKYDIKKIKTGAIELSDTRGDILVQNNTLFLNNMSTKAFHGNISGDIGMNLLTSLLKVKVSGKNIDANKMLTDAANMKDTLSGTMDFKTDISLSGATYIEQVKSLKGTIDFQAKNGQYGPFSKLENFFLAENIRENPVFKNTIGAVLSPITTIDSSHYEELKGTLKFKDGIVYLKPITSKGNILCILINGKMDLVKNELDTYVRVRLASAVSDLLGPIAMANPVNLVKNTPGLNIVTAKLFSVFTVVVAESDYKQIPDFSKNHTDKNATKFQIVLSGDVAKPLRLVKSFKWLALQEDMDKANEFSAEFVKQQEHLAKQALFDKIQKEYESNNRLKVGVEKILQMNTTAPEIKEMLVEEVLKTKAENDKKTELAKKMTADAKELAKQQLEIKVQEKKDKIKTGLKNAIEEKTKTLNEKLD